MKLKAVTRIMLTLFLASISTMAFDVVHTANELPVHNIDTGLPYETIQEAINAPKTLDGHTIQVDAGIYSEHVTVDKSLRLVGEDRGTTIIDGSGTETVAVITANNVHISGFTIRNSGPEFHSGICLTSSNNAMISGNIIIDNTWGIWLEYAADNVISENAIQNSAFAGIYLGDSTNNSISHNTITNNMEYGMWLERSDNNAIIGNTAIENGMGISLAIDSNNNTVSDNAITNNNEGIHLFSSFNNIYENTITSNWYGISSLHSGGNIIYRNNFIENLKQASLNESYIDIWDNGCEGNYWSDYNGTDQDGDGIGDTRLPHNGLDYHPLIEPWSTIRTFDITWEEKYNVTTLSNSTIASFNFNSSLKQISFNVTGPSGAVGFCNVTIPKKLMWCDTIGQWSVTVGGVSPTSYNPSENTNRTSLHFTYPHSTHRVEITSIHAIPEFPSWILMLLTLIMLTVAIAIYKRRPCARICMNRAERYLRSL